MTLTPDPDRPGPLHLQAVRSHLSEGVMLVGDLTVPGTLDLQGRVDGRVSADIIVIEASGAAKGELHARKVTIRGRFDGSIAGTDVRLLAGARVSGDIHCATLAIEAGAEVNATCKHETDPKLSLTEPSFHRRADPARTGQPSGSGKL